MRIICLLLGTVSLGFFHLCFAQMDDNERYLPDEALSSRTSKHSKFVSFDFFENEIQLTYSPHLFDGLYEPLNDEKLFDFYHKMDSWSYESTLAELWNVRERYRLNDWLYFLLIRDLAAKIYPGKEHELQQTLFCWVFLARTGYKVQLNYHREGVFLSVYTLDVVYDLPRKRHGTGYMVDISRFQKPEQYTYVASVRSDFYLNNTSMPFRLQMAEAPKLPARGQKLKRLAFMHNNRRYQIDVEIDQNMIELMESYPELSLKSHASFPISELAYESLMPQLERHLKGKSESEQLRFLLSFTRTAFEYVPDRENSTTFSAEETLFNEQSDCEDRVVLFSYLVRELMSIPVIILEYEDHAAAAVKLAKPIGHRILHRNEFYTFVEPTDTKDRLGLGEIPAELKEKTYTILLQ